MASVWYNSGMRDVLNGTIDLDTHTIGCMLVTSTYTPDVDAHTKRSDVTNEVSGTGYSSPGQNLANLAVTADNTNNRGKFDADDVTWTAASFTARGAVIYRNRGGAATADELLCYLDFGADKTASGGDFVLQFNSAGIAYLQG